MTLTKPRILFVDEDANSRTVVSAYLSGYGYEVSTVDSCVEALALAKDEVFDLLLVGYDATGAAGSELCRRVREFDRSTPIVFFSASYPDAPHPGLQLDVQGYVLKPDLAALSTKLDETLRTVHA
jgi:CheY-like chemotaxis protein